MLEEQISKDYITAMKAKDKERAATLSFLRAQIKNVKIDKKLESVEDKEVIGLLKKQVKQRQDSIQSYEDGGRQELADKERMEMEIIKEYLPQEMSESDIQAAVDASIQETNASGMQDMGQVMKIALEKTGPSADGKLVSELVKASLSKL